MNLKGNLKAVAQAKPEQHEPMEATLSTDLLLADLDKAHALCFDRGSEAAADKILDIMDAIQEKNRYHVAKSEGRR